MARYFQLLVFICWTLSKQRQIKRMIPNSLVGVSKRLVSTATNINFNYQKAAPYIYKEHPVLHKAQTRVRSEVLDTILSRNKLQIKFDCPEQTKHFATLLSTSTTYWVGEHAQTLSTSLQASLNLELKNPNQIIYDEELPMQYGFLTPFFAGKDCNTSTLKGDEIEKRTILTQANQKLSSIDSIFITSSPKDVYAAVQVIQDVLLSRSRALVEHSHEVGIPPSAFLSQNFPSWIQQRSCSEKNADFLEVLTTVERTHGVNSFQTLSMLFRIVGIPVYHLTSYENTKVSIDQAITSHRVFTSDLLLDTITTLMKNGADIEGDLNYIELIK